MAALSLAAVGGTRRKTSLQSVLDQERERKELYSPKVSDYNQRT